MPAPAKMTSLPSWRASTRPSGISTPPSHIVLMVCARKDTLSQAEPKGTDHPVLGW